jgi:hypothetical protein
MHFVNIKSVINSEQSQNITSITTLHTLFILTKFSSPRGSQTFQKTLLYPLWNAGAFLPDHTVLHKEKLYSWFLRDLVKFLLIKRIYRAYLKSSDKWRHYVGVILKMAVTYFKVTISETEEAIQYFSKNN